MRSTVSSSACLICTKESVAVRLDRCITPFPLLPTLTEIGIIYIYSFLYRKERKRRRNQKKCTNGNETQEPKTHPNNKTAPTIGNEVYYYPPRLNVKSVGAIPHQAGGPPTASSMCPVRLGFLHRNHRRSSRKTINRSLEPESSWPHRGYSQEYPLAFYSLPRTQFCS